MKVAGSPKVTRRWIDIQQPCTLQLIPNIGESPSGKALVFGTSIRRFESYLPSHEKRLTFGQSFFIVNFFGIWMRLTPNLFSII